MCMLPLDKCMHVVFNCRRNIWWSYNYVGKRFIFSSEGCRRFVFSSKDSLMRIVIMFDKDSLKDSLYFMRIVKCESNSEQNIFWFVRKE